MDQGRDLIARGARAAATAGRPLAALLLFLFSIGQSSSARGDGPAPPPIVAGHFVGVAETRFELDGQPFHFVGANAAVLHGPGDRADLEATLDAVARDHLSVVRIWALGEAPEDAPAWRRDYAFRLGPRGWVDESFEHLDRVLLAARERNLRVIVVLANRWGDHGGATEYARWAGMQPPERNLSSRGLGDFFRCEPCEQHYREHVRRVVGRVSSVTGVAYRDDPTVLAWELINEASAHTAGDEEALVGWVERQAAFVRSLDDNHLVGAGHVGYGRLRERDVWRRVQSLAQIDYCDSHAYPLQPGRVRTITALRQWIDDRVQLAHHVVGKPLVWGEVGFPTDRPVVLGRSSASWYDAFLGRSFRNGAAGALVWIYKPWRGRPRRYDLYPTARAGRTHGVRRVLRRHASRVLSRPPVERNPRLGPDVGGTPLHVAAQRVRGSRRVHDGWRPVQGGDALHLAPDDFYRATFEAAGVHRDAERGHLWGAGRGFVEFRFRGPRGGGPVTLLRLSAHLSSELPGSDPTAPEEEISTIRVELDGHAAGTLTAPPDDGRGRVVELAVTDPAVLALLSGPGRRRTHVLRMSARETPGAGGLCLYDGVGQSPGGVVLRLEHRARR